MHHALRVEDIVYAVLEHLESFADVVNVAKTCKALSDPALNMLWSEQISIIPLMKCLPEDTWEVGEDQAINFSREPTPAEWERLELNAARVRQLYNYDHSDGLPVGVR
ncbi:hypothetical protein BDR04DRAFT_1152880 [Suillus decipiens]|nr:hypothetical protein BDR04DRAFT_1152880 [Suillus decipiens]